MAKKSRREKCEDKGLVFIEEGVIHPSDPDQPVFTADMTYDAHAKHFQGKSEEQVLDECEAFLASRPSFGL